MLPRDMLLTRPWFEPVVFGIRRAFTWEPIYQGRMRVRYAMAYWNPTPGAVVTVAGERLLPDRRHLLFIPAGTWFERSNERPFDHVWCHLRVRSEPARPGAQLVAVEGELAARLESLWHNGWSVGVADPAVMADAHAAFAIALTRIAWSGGARSWTDPRLGELARWLEAQQYPPLANPDMAARLDMHPKAFCRHFREETGCPPQDWLRGKRLDLAADRLDLGQDIATVVEAGGFADRFHFGRLFRRHHGITPGHYRRLALARLADPPPPQGSRTRRP